MGVNPKLFRIARLEIDRLLSLWSDIVAKAMHVAGEILAIIASG